MVGFIFTAPFLIGALSAAQCLTIDHPSHYQPFRRQNPTTQISPLNPGNLLPSSSKIAVEIPERVTQRPTVLSKKSTPSPSCQKAYNPGGGNQNEIKYEGSYQSSRKTGSRIRRKRGLGDGRGFKESQGMIKLKGNRKELRQPGERQRSGTDGFGPRNERSISRLARLGSRRALRNNLLGGVGTRSVKFVGESSTALHAIARSHWQTAATRLKAVRALTEEGAGRVILQRVGQALEEAEHAGLTGYEWGLSWGESILGKILHAFELLGIENIQEIAELWALWCVAKTISPSEELLKLD
ncbi:hypothetical protein MJO28_017704 [Puccinia striiformis f. sp. tritici]|uniref:hypothetical protein n=1 Tax=Puccinia striiformis f. sp. tritici TaxID=168172 RepID=UPI002007C674|nr:hypothetical protein Pst134EA_026896 [Puccinia striiformis f. sp. tritici]KAH9450187.1 hypothetical protein Pst134EA_026896 [Puccinia striiformis f. sp. tritici]KAI7933328.1 hypothetical protein MJO28_017704 [Puccinia striiformis f. sp. tritici]KAI7939554.1 hypothetical protein MJO29_014290 [Puccinia striiformis f. sp. tritici]